MQMSIFRFIPFAAVLGAVLMMSPVEASAGGRCGPPENPTVAGNYGGLTWYRGLLTQKDPNTGKGVNAFAGVHVSNPAQCVQRCLSEGGCTAVTYRGNSGNNCLLFAGYDFETRRRLSIRIYNGGTSVMSTKVRHRFQGAECARN